MILPIGNNLKKKLISCFTLLELILVIVLMSILLTLAYPHIKNKVNDTRFRSFVNNFYLFLDYTKTKAVLKNVILEVKFDLANKKIFLENGKTEKFRSITIPDTVRLEMGKLDKERIIFYPDGTSQEFEITIFDKGEMISVLSSRGFDGKIDLASENRR